MIPSMRLIRAGLTTVLPSLGWPDPASAIEVKILAANLTSGTNQAYEDPGIRIFQGLEPDVVLIQEFNCLSGTRRDPVDLAFGTDYRREECGG